MDKNSVNTTHHPPSTIHRVTVDLDVSGMTCAACQANVQRALARQPGVTDASVNLMTGSARVAADPSLVSPDQLIHAVEDIGYGASLANREASAVADQERRDLQQVAEYRELRTKAAVAGAVGLATMALPMRLMHTAAVKYALLAATVAVMLWAGRQFYTRGFRALRHRVPDMNSLVAVGTGAAFIYSIVATFWPSLFMRSGMMADVYYEAVIIIIAFVLAGRALEARAKRQTAASLRGLVAMQPTTARVVD